MISYRTAWLKANYPVEYMAALISSVMNTKDKVPFYVNQCHEMGIEVLPPDVNESDVGLHRGRGQDPLRAERREGRGAWRHRGDHRRASRGPVRLGLRLLRARRLADGQQAHARGAHPQRCLRQHRRPAARHARGAAARHGRRRTAAQGRAPRAKAGSSTLAPRRHWRIHARTVPQREFDQATLLKGEKEALGLYVSRPIRSRACASSCATRSKSRWSGPRRRRGRVRCVWTGGIVANAQKKVSKNGGVWLAFRLEDVDGGVECRAWPTIYEQYRELLVEDAIIKVKGRVERKRRGRDHADRHRGAALQRRERVPPAHGDIDASACAPTGIDDLRRVLADFPGHVPVVAADGARRAARAGCGSATGCASRRSPGCTPSSRRCSGESCIGVG